MLTLLKVVFGLGIAHAIADGANGYLKKSEYERNRAIQEARLKELQAGMDVLRAYGYDKPRY